MCVRVSVRHVLFVPGGQTFLTHMRGGDKHFLHIGGMGGKTFFTYRGGQTFLYLGGETFLYLRGGDKHFLLEAVVAMMMLMKR